MRNKKKSIKHFFFRKIETEQLKRINIQKSGPRDKEPNLLNISNALDDFYFFEKLKIYANFLSYQMIIHNEVIGYHEEEFKLLVPIIELLKKEKAYHPAINIYFLLCRLLQPAPKNTVEKTILLDSIENLITTNSKDLPNGDLIEIYSHLTSYFIYQINNGENFLKKSIIYNHGLIKLEEEMNKKFSMNVGVYKNMVVLILKNKDLEKTTLDFLDKNQQSPENWAHDFADKYKENLPAIDQEKYYCYCKALILFHSKEYYNAYLRIKNLERVRTIFINFDLKVLQLQLLMELEIKDHKIFESLKIETEVEIEKLRSMLNYNKNENPKLGYQENYFRSFLNLFRSFYAFYGKNYMMFKFGDQKYHTQREALRNEILKCKYSFGEWFLEKLEEIK